MQQKQGRLSKLSLIKIINTNDKSSQDEQMQFVQSSEIIEHGVVAKSNNNPSLNLATQQNKTQLKSKIAIVDNQPVSKKLCSEQNSMAIIPNVHQQKQQFLQQKTQMRIQQNQQQLHFTCKYCLEEQEQSFFLAHQNQCGDQLIKCLNCQLILQRKNHKEHLSNCNLNTQELDLCSFCQKFIQLDKFEYHQTKQCVTQSSCILESNQNQESTFETQKHNLTQIEQFKNYQKKNGLQQEPINMIKNQKEIIFEQMGTCSFCFKEFTLNNLNQHQENCEKKKKLNENAVYIPLFYNRESDYLFEECKHCELTFSVKYLDEHYQICPKKPINCPKCQNQFPLDLLKIHLQLCNIKKEKECRRCQAEYKNKKSHRKECMLKLIVCEYCGKKFARIQMDEHQQNCEDVQNLKRLQEQLQKEEIASQQKKQIQNEQKQTQKESVKETVKEKSQAKNDNVASNLTLLGIGGLLGLVASSLMK